MVYGLELSSQTRHRLIARATHTDDLVATDVRRDRTMIALIDRGLYDRTDTLFRSVPEERAMRYSAVCTSMLMDRIKDLECQRMDAAKRVTNLEVVMDQVLKKQDNLHSKVRDQDAKRVFL